ncbi:glycosyltransferase family 4 protein [Lysinibacillus pakistanensis]|uniref:glycosyltransferase family 4 protein n=1 Tax=Lysinibacillus pakistanensis TaxID=759811 RepID=UPI003D2C4E44
MKILFVATVYRHLTAFHIPHMQYFQSLGYEVWAASGEGIYDRELLEKNNIRCVDISFSRSLKSIDNLKAISQMKRLLKKENFEYVDVHTPIASFITRYVARNLKDTKVVYTAHGFHFFKGAPLINWLLYYTAEKIAASWTTHLITINQEDYKIAKKLGYTEETVSYVHGVGVKIENQDISRIVEEDLKKEFNIQDHHVVIAYVAELNENKNHLFLLKNWSAIKKVAPNAKLLIIGKGSHENLLKKYVNENSLKDITFTGYRRDVDDILKISDLVTLLSKREGLPKSIMEAMVHGLPCVVSNTRGLRDLVEHKKNGYIVDLGNGSSLINAFSRLVNDSVEREVCGEKARVDIEIYLLENVILEYQKVYQDIMNEV